MHFTIYCHSPGGDTAAALADTGLFVLHMPMLTHNWEIMQRPWRSLRYLRAAVYYCLFNAKISIVSLTNYNTTGPVLEAVG